MASLEDIAVSAGINLMSAFMFLLAFAFLRLQPINDRVYFPKWYLTGARESPRSSGFLVKKFVNLNYSNYFKFWNFMPDALSMPDSELIDHAGLDSVIYLRIYLLGLKIFCPIALVAFVFLVPVNLTGKSLTISTNLVYSNIDKLSISNIPPGSLRFIVHVLMAYVITGWTFKVLYEEYKIVASMRLRFLASEKRRPDQFTVLVRNIPLKNDESVSEKVEQFFKSNHPDHYLTHQIVYDAERLHHYVEEKKKLENKLTYFQVKHERHPDKRPMIKEAAERAVVMNDKKAIVPAAFVSFRSRWGAAVAAQTQQTDNPTVWLTEWAPEPRDVYWNNLAVPYVKVTVSKLVMAVAMFFLTFFFMIPIAFVQSLASIEGIQQVLPFLKPLIQEDGVKALIQGFLPGIALKIFLLFLPSVLKSMSKTEGYTSLSSLDRRSAAKYYLFLLVNVFFGSIITGAAFDQLHSLLDKAPSEIPKTIGVAIPTKANFFITYVMVDGWAGVAAEILRLYPLAMYHMKNTFMVKTDQDRKEAMDPGRMHFSQSEPQVQLYFLLGLVYAAVTPVLLPFIIIFFAFSYVIYRHQIINVYNQKYESGATFWPDVHRRLIIGLIIAQLLLMGLLSTKGFARSGPVLLLLPVLTILFDRHCKGRFKSAFVAFPLQNARVKDLLEEETEPNFDLKEYLQNAYVHPVFRDKAMKLPALCDDDYDALKDIETSSSEHDMEEIEETLEQISDAVEVVTDALDIIENERRNGNIP